MQPGPGTRVRIEQPAGRVGAFTTRMTYRISTGEVVGAVAYEPSMTRVRVGGTVHRVPLDYLTPLED